MLSPDNANAGLARRCRLDLPAGQKVRMGKPNYGFDKRRRELDKKRKKEEKRRRKAEKEGGASPDTESSPESQDEADDAPRDGSGADAPSGEGDEPRES